MAKKHSPEYYDAEVRKMLHWMSPEFKAAMLRVLLVDKEKS